MKNLLSECILEVLVSCMPSIVRGYTFLPHLARQGLGLFQNELLPRVQNRSLETTDVGEGDDFQAAV